jgi:hypothetical protein
MMCSPQTRVVDDDDDDDDIDLFMDRSFSSTMGKFLSVSRA